MGFFAELKRRNVFRVGLAYLAGCWVLVQVAETLFPVYEVPDSIIRLMVSVLVIGFPVTLVLAWVFEWTPQGIRKESEIDRQQSVTPQTGQKLNRAIIVMLLVGIGFLAIDKFVLDPQRDAQLARESAQAAREQIKREVAEKAPEMNSIAVLPFRDMSAAGDQQYFSDGIAEELLNALVRVDGLEIASRTSSFIYRDDMLPITQIAEELNVNYVLEGSVRKSGDRVRITAQLINAGNDRHLWSETYDRELDDVLQVQDEISKSIVDAMKSELGLDIGEVRIASETDSASAYDLYLKGRILILARSEMYKAIEALERAVEIDPGFAKAWEVLGAAYYIAPSWGYFSEFDTMELSWAAAQKALDLDDSLALALAVKASIGLATKRYGYAKTLDLMERAIELDPKSATVRLWNALYLANVGFLDQAIDSARSCLEIDPGYENCRRHLANMEYMLGNEEEAVRLYFEGTENGFQGNEANFVPMLLRNVGREAAAMAGASMVITQGFPVGDLLDILEYPHRDHSAARQRLAQRIDSFSWRNSGDRMQTAIFFGAFDLAGDITAWDTFTFLWGPEIAEFRKSSQFKQLTENFGMVEYWRQTEFPPGCEQLPGGDFKCK